MEERYREFRCSSEPRKTWGWEVLLPAPPDRLVKTSRWAQNVKRAPSCMIRIFELKPAGPLMVPALPSASPPLL